MMIEITDGTARLTIEVLARSCPDSDYWDGNWCVTPIKAILLGFQAAFNGEMELPELQAFYQGLQQLYAELRGAAHLNTRERFLELTAEINSRGHIHWSVRLADTSGSANMARLTFEMRSDQSYLPALLAQIEAVLEMFPVKGQP